MNVLRVIQVPGLCTSPMVAITIKYETLDSWLRSQTARIVRRTAISDFIWVVSSCRLIVSYREMKAIIMSSAMIEYSTMLMISRIWVVLLIASLSPQHHS